VKKLLLVLLCAAVAQVWAQGALTVTVAPGSAYAHKVKLGLISLNFTPQTAIWIETADGRFVDTIFVTTRSAKATWYGGKSIRRPEALPLWSHARGVVAPDGLFMPDRAHPLPDAVSGATPGAAAAYSKTWKLPAGLPAGRYRVRVELNSSFDWNEAYPDKLPKTDPRWTEANGQPSIVWETEIQLGSAPSRSALAPVGTGSPRGDTGALTPGLAGITSARDLAKSIEAVYSPN
jgi:hypothetical protein